MKRILIFTLAFTLVSSCAQKPKPHCWNDPQRARIDPRDCDMDPDPVL